MLAPTNLPAVQQPAPKLHDVTIITKKDYSCARVEAVPPEEFGIERNAKSIRDCGYCFHEVPQRESKLISDGYDPVQIKKMESYTPLQATTEAQSRDTVDESRFAGGDDGLNKANRLIRITEHYCRLDYEDDGRSALYRVTTGGEQSEILRRKQDDGNTYEDEIVEIDVIPFAAMTPVIMTHRFFGRSVADLVMDIQRIKTALLRGMLDNLYLHNNPRVEVPESHASDNTLDDLLVSRPGGIVRTKQPGGLQWQVVPDITASVYPALQYFDATREWRTGVSRQGQGVDPNALQNQVATIANQMFNASQAKLKLIARIFAETGIKDLFSLLHGVIRKNGEQQQTVKLRNKWVTVDPRDWQERDDMTINVGLGTGSKTEQLAHMQLIAGLQKEAIAVGLVSKKNLWNTGKEIVKLAGRKDPESFFTPPGQQQQGQPDPDSQPLPPPPDPKEKEIQANLQIAQMGSQAKMQELTAKNEIEKTQAQADIATNNTKIQAEGALAQQKFQFEMIMAQKEYELKERLALIEANIKMEQHQQQMQLGQQDHALKTQQAEQKSALDEKKASQPKASVSVQNNSSEISQALEKLTEAMAGMSKPRKISKGKDGSYQSEVVG